MSINDRAEITNYELSQSMGAHVIVGNCFAFVKPDLFKNSPFSWLQSLFGKSQTSNKTSIVHLLKPEGVDIAGVKINPVNLGRLELSSITSDKSLYKSDNDTVDLLLINPLKAGQSARVNILCNGAPYAHRHVNLGNSGEGKLVLQDLPAGEYDVHFDGSTNSDRFCKFTVAQYKLVPLVAELKGRQTSSDGSLEMTVGLSTFGVPVNGTVTVCLFDRAVNVFSLHSDAKDGVLTFSFRLEGVGPYSLSFQPADDPGKTASLPIIGSRAAERSQTLLNPLGSEIFASLLPSEGASEVRGLYLTEGGLSSSPVRLELDDNQIPRLSTASAISSLTIISIDPAFPQRRADASGAASQQHPSHYDQDYNGATRLFERGLYEDSLRLFAQARSKQGNPHPYYAYYMACCHAKLNQIDQAIDQLRLSIIDGWDEFIHLQEDEDLSSLRGDDRFEEMKYGGIAEHTFEDLPANHVIEFPARKAMNLLLLGAVVNNQDWEGWTSFVMPSAISAVVEAAGEFKSGHYADLKIKISGNGKDCSAYVVVKDARLLSQDKPEARLAAAMKEYAESASKELRQDYPTTTVASLGAESCRKVKYMRSAARDEWSSTGSFGALGAAFDTAVARSSPSPPSAPAAAPPSGWQGSERLRGAAGGSAGAWQEEADEIFAGSAGLGSLFACKESGASAPVQAMSGASEMSGTATAVSAPVLQKGQEPEVLFSDFVVVRNSEANLEIPLPLAEADYLVDCFVMSDWDWCSAEGRFRAVSDPLAEFTLPRFVSAGENAQAWLHVGSRSQEFKCTLTHDGNLIELRRDSKSLSRDELLKEALVNLQFNAGPGVYTASLADTAGNTICRIEQTVDEPGKLKRRLRSMRLLKEGESVALKDDPSIVALRILPGLKESFELLLDATADYSHCCCEQTAAKILSGCAMFMFSGEDGKRRETAEAVIIAGISREERMWLRSRGFKAYPERPDTPDQHYGRMAAQHLANLSLLDSQRQIMSRDLRAAVDLGTKMSCDALAAYGIVFPPKSVQSMQDAYAICRFSNNGIVQQAVDHVRKKTSSVDEFLKGVEYNPNWGYAVNSRVEAAYAAAALMRQKQGADLGKSLALANHVIKSFNEQGRLYSTIDSVAAIALFAEMIAAKLVGGAGAGKAEINGILTKLDEAIAGDTCIESIKCVDGIVAVEVETETEEDWSAFDGRLPLRVSLEKNGQSLRLFKLGDQVNLRVRLEQGYKDGDILWVCLPDSFSRVYGGGQVKLFSVDFAGEPEIIVPLAVTGSSEKSDGQKGQHSLALCVRNMYEEERGGNPGLIRLSVGS